MRVADAGRPKGIDNRVKSKDPEQDCPLLMRAQAMVEVGTWVAAVDPSTLALGDVRWSNEMYRLVGRKPVSGPPTWDEFMAFMHPVDADRIRDLVFGALHHRVPFRTDHRVAVPGDRLKMHHLRANVVTDDAGMVTHILGTWVDVTERFKAEQALADNEGRLRAVFEQSAVGMAVAAGDGRLIEVNHSFASMLGYSRSDLEGRSIIDITHPDDREMTRLMTFDAPGFKSHTYEKRYLHVDGEAVWARATVSRLVYGSEKTTGYMAVIEDIGEQKRAALELARQTEVLRGMLEHLPVMVARVDGTGRLLYSNREAQRVFGWSATAVAKDVLSTAFPDPLRREEALHLMRAAKAEWVDLEPQAADGRIVPSSWAAISLSGGAFLMIGKDLTEIRRMQQGLAQSQKMEALGQLAGGVAHDFNNLLTVIAASASFIRDAAEEHETIVADAQEIQTACARAAALTRQLLAFSRRQMLEPEVVDVNDCINTLGKTMRRLIGEHIELDLACEAQLSSAEVDRHQLEQVILNLAVNARDAIKEHGTISVGTRNEPDARTGAPQILITVRDDGSGIPQSVMHRIFEPFFTTKPVGKGTGLGLATVHGIVEQSGGSVTVSSVVGKGTAFTVRLPAIGAVQCPLRKPEAATAVTGNERILLVEDESAIRSIGRRILTSLGYSVFEARHGRDALDQIDNGATVDLLVTDVVMPEMNGRQLAAEVRARHPELPVLYVSGYTDDELLRRGVLESGARLLRKPFSKKDLAEAVRALLEARRAYAAGAAGAA